MNLPLRVDKDRTTIFAASLAGYYGAHVTGIAFTYWLLVVCVQMGAAEERAGNDSRTAQRDVAPIVATLKSLAATAMYTSCVMMKFEMNGS